MGQHRPCGAAGGWVMVPPPPPFHHHQQHSQPPPPSRPIAPWGARRQVGAVGLQQLRVGGGFPRCPPLRLRPLVPGGGIGGGQCVRL